MRHPHGRGEIELAGLGRKVREASPLPFGDVRASPEGYQIQSLQVVCWETLNELVAANSFNRVATILRIDIPRAGDW